MKTNTTEKLVVHNLLQERADLREKLRLLKIELKTSRQYNTQLRMELLRTRAILRAVDPLEGEVPFY